MKKYRTNMRQQWTDFFPLQPFQQFRDIHQAMQQGFFRFRLSLRCLYFLSPYCRFYYIAAAF